MPDSGPAFLSLAPYGHVRVCLELVDVDRGASFKAQTLTLSTYKV
jgi:hypothetical protein